MVVFPAVITPTAAIGAVFIPFILVPIALIAFIVWQIRKLNIIEEKLVCIQEILKDK
ncbi:hypothetical protein AAC978_11370 [Desulfitobacterium sp. THU1]|uniref:hypothetical protein n=1 Tax=Desulfitobacterium sp. THU1 TaxID=3138072 RepID=UPI00311FB5DA